MTDKIVVLTTCSAPQEATQIARALVEKRLAACVNVVRQVQSVYRWRNAIEETEEILLLIKSDREKFAALKAELEHMHSYEVPEVVALPIVDGSSAYLSWLDRELRPAPEPV